jgi:hypothetical protein
MVITSRYALRVTRLARGRENNGESDGRFGTSSQLDKWLDYGAILSKIYVLFGELGSCAVLQINFDTACLKFHHLHSSILDEST